MDVLASEIFHQKKYSKGRGVFQVIELLPCKCKALSSNPNAAQKRKGREAQHLTLWVLLFS
jgi:hypothetical protein